MDYLFTSIWIIIGASLIKHSHVGHFHVHRNIHYVKIFIMAYPINSCWIAKGAFLSKCFKVGTFHAHRNIQYDKGILNGISLQLNLDNYRCLSDHTLYSFMLIVKSNT